MNKFTWSYGYFFHVEHAPDEKELQKEAEKVGDKSKGMEEGAWQLVILERKRQIMDKRFPEARSYKCCAC